MEWSLFEGNAAELRASTDPVHPDLPVIEDVSNAAHTFVGLVGAEDRTVVSFFAIVIASFLIFLLSG